MSLGPLDTAIAKARRLKAEAYEMLFEALNMDVSKRRRTQLRHAAIARLMQAGNHDRLVAHQNVYRGKGG